MDSKLVGRIDEALEASVGQNPADIPVEGGSGLSVYSWLVETGSLIPPWWSKARDRVLSRIWKTNNHLSIAVYNTQAKLVGIPFRIRAKDASNPLHVQEAKDLEQSLFVTSEFGQGWPMGYGRFIEDLLTTDNGGFLEIIGEGEADGPIIGRPLSVRHLDSSRVTRTGNPVFPVLYMDDDGRLYKLHWTRVIAMSQMTSAKREMNGVGVCALSRSVEIAQTLADMVNYKQQRLGSRPHSQMIVGKGVTGKQIMMALRKTEEEMDNMGFTRYARTVAIGSENTDIGIEKIDLNHLDPFNEEVSTNLGMFAIASAFGMDADELWPVGGRSTSQGEANLRRMRSRGRLPAQLTQDVALQFNFKFLPAHLHMDFDFHDDEEDQQRAMIQDIRARNRDRDLGDGAIDTHTARLRMMEDGDITHEQYTAMELNDGRLPDGTPLAILFFQEAMKPLLDVGANPLAISDNDPDEMIGVIQRQREVVLQQWADEPGNEKRLAYYALDWLEEQYAFAAGRILPPVPFGRRSSRTDIRVVPAEDSPPEGAQSPAQAETQSGENIPNTGG